MPLAIPVLLLLAFLGRQFSGFDSIGWSHGFSHPLEGWDHLVTMLAVGVWAAQMRGKAIWLLPLSFVGVMSLGGLAGAAGLSIPSVEGIILLSCAVFSVLITRKIRFNTYVNVLIVGFFAFFHGFAHGQEISTSASLVSYTLGFMLATLLLHGAGILVAKLVVISFVSLLAVLTASEVEADTYAASPVTATQSVAKQAWWIEHTQGYTVQQTDCNASVPAEHTGLTTCGYLPQHPSAPVAALPLPVVHWAMAALTVLLGFNAYYPNINNSPGTSLLSSGVGLTSPPLRVLLFSAPFPPCYSAPNSCFVVPSLQASYLSSLLLAMLGFADLRLRVVVRAKSTQHLERYALLLYTRCKPPEKPPPLQPRSLHANKKL